MDARTVKKQFLRMNKTLGLLTGVWPYQNARTKLVGQVVSLSLMFTGVFTQIAYLVLFPSVDGTVSSMPFCMASLGTFVKMGNYFLDESKLRSMLNNVFDDWTAIKTKEEYDIMFLYSQRGALVAFGYFLHLAIAGSLFVCIPFLPPILDIIAPLNESRKRMFIYPAYYWLDYDEYYVLIIGHMIIISCMVCSIFCACDMNYVYAVQHACGLLAITRHRFRNVYKDLPVDDGKDDTRSLDKIKYKNVCHSIQAHQHALKYLELIENNHQTYLFISMGMLITAFSVILLKVASDDHHMQWFAHCIFFLAILFHVFVLTVQGQFVINALQEVYHAIYESPWYKFPPKTQVLYVVVLRSCLNPPLLTAGGLITLNLRSFAEIIKASVSYYTMMQSK